MSETKAALESSAVKLLSNDNVRAVLLLLRSRATQRRRQSYGYLVGIVASIMLGVWFVLNAQQLVYIDVESELKFQRDRLTELRSDRNVVTEALEKMYEDAHLSLSGTWSVSYFSPSEDYPISVDRVGSVHWVGGYYGGVYRSDTFGADFEQISGFGEDVSIYDISFSSESIGLVVSDGDSSLSTTTDGGRSWENHPEYDCSQSEKQASIVYVQCDELLKVVGSTRSQVSLTQIDELLAAAFPEAEQPIVEEPSRDVEELEEIIFIGHNIDNEFDVNNNELWVVKDSVIFVQPKGSTDWSILPIEEGNTAAIWVFEQIGVIYTDNDRLLPIGKDSDGNWKPIGAGFLFDFPESAHWIAPFGDNSFVYFDSQARLFRFNSMVGQPEEMAFPGLLDEFTAIWTFEDSVVLAGLDNDAEKSVLWVLHGTTDSYDQNNIDDFLSGTTNPNIVGLLTNIEGRINEISILDLQIVAQQNEVIAGIGKGADTNGSAGVVDKFFGPVTVVRIAILALLGFFLQLLVSLYRYAARISAFYDSRADALLIAGDSEKLGNMVEYLSPNTVDFRIPKISVDQLLETIKTISKRSAEP